MARRLTKQNSSREKRLMRLIPHLTKISQCRALWIALNQLLLFSSSRNFAVSYCETYPRRPTVVHPLQQSQQRDPNIFDHLLRIPLAPARMAKAHITHAEGADSAL